MRALARRALALARRACPQRARAGTARRPCRYDLGELVTGTRASVWYDFRHHWNRSTYYANHEADLLRLLMLRQRGGVYVDADFILLRPLPRAPHTCPDGMLGIESGEGGARVHGGLLAGAEVEGGGALPSGATLCNALMAFERGSAYLDAALEAFVSEYVPYPPEVRSENCTIPTCGPTASTAHASSWRVCGAAARFLGTATRWRVGRDGATPAHARCTPPWRGRPVYARTASTVPDRARRDSSRLRRVGRRARRARPAPTPRPGPRPATGPTPSVHAGESTRTRVPSVDVMTGSRIIAWLVPAQAPLLASLRSRSLGVHYWNQLSRDAPIVCGGLMHRLLEENCVVCTRLPCVARA